LEFDDEESECGRILEGVDLIAVYLGTAYGNSMLRYDSDSGEPKSERFTAIWLIVEEQGLGMYRRVGAGFVFQYVSRDIEVRAGIGPPWSWIPDSKLKHVEDKWQKRTLRLV
jgi:hypothetical protein